jgi:hypothetical protein
VDRGDRQQGHAYRLAPLIEVDNQVSLTASELLLTRSASSMVGVSVSGK